VTDSQGQWSEPDVAPADPGLDARRGVDGGPEPGAPAAPPAPAAPSAPPGLVYGDVTSRLVAFIVDGILIGIVSGVLQVVASLIFGPAYSLSEGGAVATGDLSVNYLTVFIDAIIGIAVSFAYFSVLWTTQRATLGMRVLALQVVKETDGVTIAANQAVVRWAALFGPLALSQAFWPVPALGSLIGLLSFVWVLILLVTTALSPTKQGMHDRYAHTMVMKVTARVG